LTYSTLLFIALAVFFHCIFVFLFNNCGVFTTFLVTGPANATPYLVSRFVLRIVITIVFIAIVLSDVVNSMSLNRDGFQ